MDSKKIEELLNKYWEGQTSIAEEKELKAFFEREDIPAEWKAYQWQFKYFSKANTSQNNPLEPDPAIWMENLEKDIQVNSQMPKEDGKQIKLQPRRILLWGAQIAASLLLVTFGFLLGRSTIGNQASNAPTNVKLTEIEKNVTDLKQMLVFSMLKQSSASERIKGVNFTSEIKEPNPQILDVLIETMNSDENVNVRLAAANALLTWESDQRVRRALIESLSIQDDPVMQIALINMLILLRDKDSVEPIEKFLERGEIPSNVKEKIREELQSI